MYGHTPLRRLENSSFRHQPEVFEATRAYGDALPTANLELGGREAWIAPILDWIRQMPRLREAHRSQYLSWHCEGRAVLQIRPTKKGLSITAGVAYSKPTKWKRPAPYTLAVRGPLTAAETHRTVAAVARAAADRLEGADAGHQEHRLQSLLQGRDLKLLRMDREFPAFRPGGARGFIDFLGVNARGALRVVETKLGADEMLVFQGLDYWIWARTHSKDLAQHFGLETERPRIGIDFVVGSRVDGEPPVGPYTAAQAEALTGEIPWRFHTVSSLSTGTPVLAGSPPRTVPASAPRAVDQRRYASVLHEHLVAHAASSGFALAANHRYVEPVGLLPPARLVADRLTGAGLAHPQLAHVRSSQAFALNMFAPLGDEARQTLLREECGLDLEMTEPPEFEFSDAADALGERTHASPHGTQVDVVLAGRDGHDARHVVFVEVKLSEPGFNPCSAYLAEANDRRDVCAHNGPFGRDPAACFQLRNHDREHRRRYDEFLGELVSPEPSPPAGCWFRVTNQVMRNVALARVLVARGDAMAVTVALCAPAEHQVIWQRWREALPQFAEVEGIRFADLPAATVLSYHDESTAEDLAARYTIAG